MVAIFTGQGAGFERGSGASLGGVGLLGSSGLGRNGEQVFVNAATGNFLISQRDEFLVGKGPDVAISRTYNSQGALDENGDDWRQSTDRRVFGLTGTVNAAGSSVKRVSADGSEITYSWNGSVYEAVDGAGAYDHLTYSGGVWTWTDGDSRVTETYAAHGTDNWRITSLSDRDGNALSFTYVGDKLDKVTTADGAYTQYSWAGNNITQIVTGYTDLATSTSKALTRTRYTYDGSNRLQMVTVDLSPGDNSVADNQVYTTTYTYHGTTNRIATISQTDGSLLAIAYDGSGRVQTLTQTVATGETRVTSFAYSAGRTDITDPRGQVTKLYYDNAGQLTRIDSPPAETGASVLSVLFAYDALGNVTSVTDAANAVTQYRYDANGNVSYVRYPNGSTTLRTYDSDNHITQEITTGATITLPGTAANQAPVAATNSVTVTQALGGDINLDLTALFSDPGDTLTFTPTGLPSGVTFDGRYLTGTPSSTGTYSIGVSASDGSLSASKTFTLSIVPASNLAPVAATSVDDVTQTEGGSLTLDLADLFVDPESQTLTYSATNIPAGLTLSGSVLSGIPTTAGTYTLTVSASDGTNVTQKTVTITIEAPSGGTVNPTNVSLAAFYDNPADGSITYAASGYPSGLSVSGGVLSGTAAAAGSYTVTVTATKVTTLTVTESSAGGTAPSIPSGMTPAVGSSGDDWGVDIAGNQAWDGVSGWDTLELSGAPSDYSFYLDSSGVGIIVNNASGDIDTVENIDVLYFSGDGTYLGVDYFFGVREGTSAAETVVGTSNAELIEAGDGNDMIYGGLGNDYIDGGTGWDRINLLGEKTDYTFLRHPDGKISIINNVTGEHDVVWNIEQFAWMNGPWGDQVGDLGVTDVTYAAPALVTTGSSITPTNLDLASLFGDPSDGTIVYDVSGYPSGLSVSNGVLSGTASAAGNYTITVTATKVTTLSVTMSSGTSSTPPSIPSGMTPVVGTSGADIITDTAGNQAYDGGDGWDVLTLAGTEADYTFYQASTGEGIIVHNASGEIDTVTNFDAFEFTGASGYWGTYYYIGVREGTSAAETVVGTSGAELLEAGDGNDMIYGGLGNDYIDGGAGWDRLNLLGAKTDYTFLRHPDGKLSVINNVTGEHDVVWNIEQFAWVDGPYGDVIGDLTITDVAYAAPALVTSSGSTPPAVSGFTNIVFGTIPSGSGGATATFDTGSMTFPAVSPPGSSPVLAADITAALTDAGASNTRFVYDAEGHLRYQVSAEGHVTEFRYLATGELEYAITYPGHAYSGASTPTLSQMDTWRNGLADRSTTQVVRNYYDARGALDHTSSYGIATTAGAASTSEGYAETYYTYDQAGQLLSRHTGSNATESFVYDGMGRLVASTDLAGGTTSIAFQDASTTTVVTSALGSVTTSVYNKAGNLISQTDSGSDSASAGLTTYLYDANGQVRRASVRYGRTGNERTDNSYFLYDKMGRKVADIGHEGELVEYRYDAAGRVAATIHYANKLTAAQISSLDNPASEIELSTLRPALHDFDIWQWSVYDTAGHVIQTVEGDGSVTRYEYDHADRLILAYTYYNKLSVSAYMTAASLGPGATQPATHAKDAVTRTFYDRDGRLIGALSAEGNLSQVVYDGAGQKISETVYANATAANLRASGTYDQLWASVTKDANKDITARYIYDGQGLLRYTIDALGRVTENVYGSSSDAIGLVRQVIQHTSALGTLGSYTYASVKAAVAALGSTGTNRSDWMIYNTRGQLAYQVDAEGSVTSFVYDAQGNVTKTIAYAIARSTTSLPSLATMDSWASANSANARITRAYYSAGGHLLATVDAEGYVTRNYYDAQGRIWSSERYSGKVTATDAWTIANVDAAGKGTSVLTQYRYDRFGRLSDVYDPNGSRTSTFYYATGMKSWDIVAYGQGTDESRILYQYNHAGNLGSVRHYLDGSGTSWTGNYVATGGYSYDGLGNLSSVTDPNGHVTSYTYDKLGRVLTQTDAESGVVTYQYDAFGNVVKVTDARGNATYNYYDRAGRLTASVDAETYLTTTSYTAFGEVQSVKRFYNKVSGTPTIASYTAPATHALDATTAFEYDKLGRLKKTIDAEQAYEENWYDALGQRFQSRNKLGGVTTYQFDKIGRLIQETLPVAAYRMDGTIEANNIVNKFEYDSRGNQTKTIEAYGLTEQRTTTYAYDSVNRVISITGDSVQTVSSATGATASAAPVETFVYDRRGNVIEHTDASGQRTLAWYDKLDRVTHQLVQKSATQGALVQNIYDANGNIIETRAYETLVTLPANATGTAPAGSGAYRVTTFTYDGLNRLETSVVPSIQTGVFNGTSYTVTTGSLTTTYEYDANGNVVRTTDPNGAQTYVYYDKLGRKTVQIDASNYRTNWTYNSEGNVLSETRYATASTTPSSLTTPPALPSSNAADRITNFTYDKMGRRLTETRKNVQIHDGYGAHTTQDSVITYTYNGLGQVLTKKEAVDAGGGATNTYGYDVAGRLTLETRKAYTDQDGTSVTPIVDYRYDGLGNLVRNVARGKTSGEDRITRFEYVAGGQLKRTIDASGFSRYFYYDAAGRVRREEYDRTTPTGSVHEAIGTDYDQAGRVIAQGAMKLSGSVWTRTGTDIDTAVMHYNAFDELTERGLNDVYAEKFYYDKAGRLIRTNSGDGVWKHFLYDRNGNQTLAVTSDGTDLGAAAYDTLAEIITAFGGASGLGTTYVNGIVTTITTYDARGLALSVREPQRELSATGTRQTLITSRTYNAFGDVVSETNADSKTVDYTYNTMGRRIKTESPTVSITLENGTAQNVRPTENYYYDASGRLVASRDANSNLTRLELLAGTGFGGGEALVTKTTTADGAFTEVKYDILGDARTMIDQISRSTTQTYDHMGRVTQVNHAGGLIDYYQYDGLGQQIKHYNNVLGASMAETTLYDQQGRIQQQIAMGGETTSHAYVWSGTLATSGLGTFGGWTETTTYANGKTLTEKTDMFGHSTYKNDLGSHVYNYTYDAAGRLASSSDGKSYTWLNTGRVSTASNSGTSSTYSGGTQSYALLTTYRYDKAGNLTFEELKDGSVVLSSQSGSYDALGRLETWTSAAADATPYATSTFKYDANGNIRNRNLIYTTISGDGSDGSQLTYDYWYRFDALNRVVTQDGSFDTGTNQIVRGYHGTDVFYDAAGQREYTLRNKTITTGGSGGGGGGSGGTIDDQIGDGSLPGGGGPSVPTTENFILREDYSYFASGALNTVSIAEGAHVATGYGVAPSSAGAVRASFTYDLMGRQTQQKDFEADGTTVAFQRDTVYNAKSQATLDTTYTRRGSTVYKAETTQNYGTGANYALGAQVFTTTRNWQGSTETAATRSDYDFIWFDGAQQSHMSFDENTANGSNTIYHTNYGYHNDGAAAWAHVWDGSPRLNQYTVNSNGQVIRREERKFVNTTTLETTGQNSAFYLFGGKQMGEIGARDTGKDYRASIAYRTENAPINPITREPYERRTNDFSQSLTPITSFDQGSTAGSYTVRAGETLRSIAANVWGDSSLWYKIAEANGMTGESALIEGASLRLPVGVVKNTHNASTFQPYDPAESIGDTAPTTPKPPKKNKCGVFGQVLLVVVAVVVSIYTAGAAAGAIGGVLSGTGAGAGALAGLGAVGTSGLAGAFAAGAGLTAAGATFTTLGALTVGAAAGAIGGAVGSIASQALGVATGIQDKFSWTAVASSALGGGLGGAGKLGIDSNILRAGASNAISQAAGIALGPQKKFDWAGVAAAGIGAGARGWISANGDGGIAGGIGHGIGDGIDGSGRLAFGLTQGIGGAASAIASAATRSALTGESFADGIRASIPDVIGQAIGNYISACFVGDTLIHTPGGLKRIDEIRVGDWVYARDEDFNSDVVHRKQVMELFRYEDRATLDVTITGADGQAVTLRTTPEHPFAIEGQGWVPAGELVEGQYTIDIQGRAGTVTRLEPVKGLSTVHNFAVADDHTYFVSELGVWVHNEYKEAINKAEADPVKKGPQKVKGGTLNLDGFEEAFYEVTGPADDYSDAEKLAAFGLTALTPGKSQLLSGAMLARGGVDTVTGVGQAAWESSIFGQSLKLFKYATDGDYRANEARSAMSAVSFLWDKAQEYGGYGPFASSAIGYDVGRWAGGVLRQEAITAGGTILEGDGSYLSVIDAGYNDLPLGSNLLFTVATAPVGLEAAATKLGAGGNIGRVLTELNVAERGEFIGPLIGKSGFRTSSEFSEAVGVRYQSYVDEAYQSALRLEEKGLLRGNKNTRVGDFVDRRSMRRIRAYLASEGISEGPGSLIQVNRWLRDPSGSGLYVRPDIRIPSAQQIFDGTIGFKSYDSTQIVRFSEYSNGDYISVIRPSPVGGSYSILP